VRARIAIKAAIILTLAIMPQAVFAGGVEETTNDSRNGLLETARALRQDPQFQERMREQKLQELKDIYGDFVKEHRFGAQQTQRFYQLLLDEAVESFIQGAEFVDNVTEESGPTAEAPSNREAELDRQLRLLIGDAVVARLEQYTKTGSARLFLAQYRHELRMTDIALPERTAKPLFEIISEEKARTPPLAFDPRNFTANADLRKALEGDNAQRYYEAESDLNRRILNRASAVLNQEQYEALMKFQQRHLAAEKAGIEATRRMVLRSQEESAESPKD
jgi:hypothetical protein